MKISERLQMIASMVSPCNTVADIGTDHGYVPIYLIEQHVAEKAIAMDVRKGPLERANEHITVHQLEEKIETRLSNGFEKLEAGEADCAVIAGLGGELMIRILEQGKKTAKELKELILSPQSEIPMVRHYLAEQGYNIVEEQMIKEDGKYYIVMRVKPDVPYEMTEEEYLYGRWLIYEKPEVFMEYLKREEHKYIEILDSLRKHGGTQNEERMAEIENQLMILKKVL